jgi:hypothetical protein
MWANLVTKTKVWIAEPFSPSMSLLQVFLLVGVIGISAALWGRILAQMSEDL